MGSTAGMAPTLIGRLGRSMVYRCRIASATARRVRTQFAAPTYTLDQLNPDLGLFVQDQWRAGRFTINVGLRFDWVHESVPAISEPAGPLVPARRFAAVDDVPNWKDLNPRFGIA